MFAAVLSSATVFILFHCCQEAAGAGLIGDTCTLDGSSPCTVQNSYCQKNSVCQLGTCKCLSGYVNLDSTNSNCAIALIGVGYQCLGTPQCGKNAVCTGSSSRACQCPSGYEMNPDGISCFKNDKPLGDTCFADADCGDNAICGGNGCACSPGYKAFDVYNCYQATYGDSCTVGVTDCDASKGLQCLNGQTVCLCPPGQVWMNVDVGMLTGFQCIDARASFNQTYGQACHDVSSCSTDVVQLGCADNLYCMECPEDAGTCIRKCLIDSDNECLSTPCQNGGTCIQIRPAGYVCSCSVGFSGNNCEMPKGHGLIGDACTLDGLMPCTATNSYCLKNSVCQLGICTCMTNYVNSGNTNTACVPASLQIGKACVTAAQCGTNAVCTNPTRTCQCPVSYRVALDNVNCLPGFKQLGASCSFNSDCGLLALCTGNTCQCRNAAYLPSPSNSYDCRYLTNGEACSSTNDGCNVDLSLSCVGGQCQCPAGYMWYNVLSGMFSLGYQCVDDAALFNLSYGQPCNDLLSCPNAAVTQACGSADLICQSCPENANTCSARKCLISSDDSFCLSAPCQNGGTCTNNASGYTCSCTVGWWGTNCERALAGHGLIGDPCTATNPCSVSNAYCLKSTVCQLGKCQCSTGYINLDSTNTVCAQANIGIGYHCDGVVQCGKNAVCTASHICQCPQGYEMNPDGINCFKNDKPLSDTCFSDTDCGDNAVCPGGACVCATGFKAIDLYNCAEASYSESCTVGVTDCDASKGLQCLNTMCQCPSGQVWMNVVVGTASPGYQCIDTRAIFNQLYGQQCSDLLACSGTPATMKTCSIGLTCDTCPENAACTRQCLVSSDMTYCSSSPCQNGGTCTNIQGSYSCVCKTGWTGTNCDQPTGHGLIGDTCTTDGTRNCVAANSFCLKSSVCQLGICQCQQGYVNLNSSNNICVPASLAVGASCVIGAQCGKNAACSSSTQTCQCPAALRTDTNNIDCLQGTVMLYATCTTNSDCGDLAICTGSTTRTCQCRNTEYLAVDSYSCRLLTYGESCNTANDACDVDNGLSCDAGSSQCTCTGGQVWTYVRGTLAPGYMCFDATGVFNRTYGDVCYDLTSSCGNGGVQRACEEGLMCDECPEDAGTCSNKCLLNMNELYCLSSPCQNEGSCIDQPSGYRCECSVGWYGDNCELARANAGNVGDTCTLDGTSPCTASNSYCLKNSFCQLGVCQCNVGYVLLPGSTTACVQGSIPVSGSCSYRVQCGQNAVCSSSTFLCQCPAGYRPDVNGIDCASGTVAIGQTCSSSSDCGLLTTCTGSKCQCGTAAYLPAANNFDCRYLTNGEICDVNNSGCDFNKGLSCVSGQCVCASGFTWVNVPESGYQCVDSTSVFDRTYGENCHMLPSTCSSSTMLRGCTAGLYCSECPELTGSCMRQCLVIDSTTDITSTTTTPVPTTALPTTTTKSPVITTIVGSATTTTTAGSATTTTTAGSATTTTSAGSATTTTTAGSATTKVGSATSTTSASNPNTSTTSSSSSSSSTSQTSSATVKSITSSTTAPPNHSSRLTYCWATLALLVLCYLML